MPAKLLLGMAVYDDFDGLWSTIQSLRLHHSDMMPLIEIAVVDNNPTSEDGKTTKDLMGWIKGDVANIHYVPFTGTTGTAAPRDLLFKTGEAPAVVCIDPHVLFAPGSIKRLIDFYDRNPHTQDLYHGPMIYDDLKNFSTHFTDVWGDDQMWGKWGTDLRGEDPNAPPFEIPAMGLGLFTCRREAWLGFNPNFRGFGGEEWYIHEKFRKRGHKVWCLPFLRWLHRFGRPGGVKYPLQLWDKARNYIIGLTELEISLDRAKQSFVGSGRISEENWQALLQGKDQPVSQNGCGCNKNIQLTDTNTPTLNNLFEWVKKTPRDLDQHADYIRDLVSRSARVTAFVKRREWNIILAEGKPRSLIVYQKENDQMLNIVHAAIKKEIVDPPMTYTTIVGPEADSLISDIEETDLLVIDTVHHADRLWSELTKHGHKVTQRILVRGTGAFGEVAEGGGPGLLPAIRKWVQEHKEWTVVYSTKAQYGLAVLSKDPTDKKKLPSLWQQGVNAAKASWRAGTNVLVGYGPLQDTPIQNERLGLCLLCDSHSDGRCAECGCPVDRKSSHPTEFCPLGKWEIVDVSQLPASDVQPST